ncbi:copper-binding protein [Grimontia kaedaensis]|uniref:Copper-binding protein n=1 Tax=Grimontia kaedaensis TaxID=2872157 RepID=A0ABY4WP77_9GAMM|nr:copper-binding protein [Grimontia kaedaensis]USH01381.1 copper-binding protein [Grimontia kaedaensis]
MKKTLIALSLALLTTGVFADTMDHVSKDHSTMNHGEMDHSKMDHSNMMNMEGMSAVGMPATGAKPDKVIHVILTDDMRINFKKDVTIEPNDVVQFVVINAGKIAHEFSIGSMEEQLKRREMIKTMTSDHDSSSTVAVKPGKAKQILWHFHGDKNVEFACNIPGHAEAGMVKSVKL